MKKEKDCVAKTQGCVLSLLIYRGREQGALGRKSGDNVKLREVGEWDTGEGGF